MIGQESLLSNIDKQIQEGTFPRFVIILGPEGSGKRLVVNHIYEQMKQVSDIELAEFGTSVNDVRDAIKMSYKMVTKAIYFFPDTDGMSVAAKNALLKVTEEPPNNVYFIMTLESECNTLETILSRATVYHMIPYSDLDIRMYALSKQVLTKEEQLNIVSWTCDNIGDVDKLLAIGVDELNDYVIKVMHNISTVSGANAFKIADKVALKETSKGYDLKLFWKMFCRHCVYEADKLLGTDDKDTIRKYMKALDITCKSLNDLQVKGINKAGLFDLWILDIRKEWM